MIFNYGIPSYARPQCKTVDTLLKAGVKTENIYVSLQDESQITEYKKWHPDVNFLFRKADCAAGNRNTILAHVPLPLILLDDDISSITIKLPGRNFKSAYEKERWLPILEKAITVAKENRCSIIGIAPTANSIIAANRRQYSFDVLLQGSFLVVLETIRFDDRWKMCEDFELSLRTIRHGHTMRINHMSVNKPRNGTNSGGMHELYGGGIYLCG